MTGQDRLPPGPGILEHGLHGRETQHALPRDTAQAVPVEGGSAQGEHRAITCGRERIHREGSPPVSPGREEADGSQSGRR